MPDAGSPRVVVRFAAAATLLAAACLAVTSCTTPGYGSDDCQSLAGAGTPGTSADLVLARGGSTHRSGSGSGYHSRSGSHDYGEGSDSSTTRHSDDYDYGEGSDSSTTRRSGLGDDEDDDPYQPRPRSTGYRYYSSPGPGSGGCADCTASPGTGYDGGYGEDGCASPTP
ncbi:MAG TPA: hypothetical protein VGN37_11255 [Actinocatenispora sp.]